MIFDKTEVFNIVNKEFPSTEFKMRWFDFTSMEAKKANDKLLNRPGGYVFYDEKGPMKIGKSNDNPMKRAITGWEKLIPDPKRLLIITMDNKLLHWVYALEIFLEVTFREGNYVYFTRADRL